MSTLPSMQNDEIANKIRDAMSKHPEIECEPGLTQEEFLKIKEQFGIEFPPDLKFLYSIFLPIIEIRVKDRKAYGNIDFPNWRLAIKGNEDAIKLIRKKIIYALLCLTNDKVFDDYNNESFNEEVALKTYKEKYSHIPFPIPIYSHRVMPATPCEFGNPVFSMHEFDNIVYGDNIVDYFRHEFRIYFKRPVLKNHFEHKFIPYYYDYDYCDHHINNNEFNNDDVYYSNPFQDEDNENLNDEKDNNVMDQSISSDHELNINPYLSSQSVDRKKITLEDEKLIEEVKEKLKIEDKDKKIKELGETLFFFILEFIPDYHLNIFKESSDYYLSSILTGILINAEADVLLNVISSTSILLKTFKEIIGELKKKSQIKFN